MNKGLIKILMLSICVCHGICLYATHVRSADLKVQPVLPCINGILTYQITVVLYLDNHKSEGNNNPTPAGADSWLNFGHGAEVRIFTSQFTTVERTDLGEDISVATFTTTHTFPGFGTYLVSFREGDRSTGILNIANSHDVDYITFVELAIDSRYTCNKLPVLTIPPLDKGCRQIEFTHSAGAFDDINEQDSLSYELSIPAQSRTLPAGYTSPINPTFYAGIFNVGNQADTGPPTFSIDAITGLLTWDAPGQAGEYNVAFKIVEWRKDPLAGTYFKLSTTTRDMQIEVESCPNRKPQLIIPPDICVVAGTLIDKSIVGKDFDLNNVKIEVLGEVVELDAAAFPASYSPNPAVFQSSNPQAQLQFQWQTDCMHVRSKPYQVVFKITDSPLTGTGPSLVEFKIWSIKVVAPAPVLQNAQLDIARNRAILDWESYRCDNASSIQVWRKVGPYDYDPGLCDVGVPRSVGYNLIATLPKGSTNFIDNNSGLGLSPGAVYCYRLVAYFNAPASTASKVSVEMCVGPVEADAPVITHVSVQETSTSNGKIRVSWRSPLDINREQFPPNTYEYEIYRADDFIGETNITKAGRVSDTTFVDPAVNTLGKIYNYRIVLFAQPPLATEKIAVDTSAVASSERLSATHGFGLISLSWRDSVPWSNVVQERPYHLIYRGIDDSDPDDMLLYDSVNVADSSYTYVDEGPLDDDRVYSYRILTRGSYGNPLIKLQENFSQVVSAWTQSTLLPCTPLVTIDTLDCNQYLTGANCNETVFANKMAWSIKALSGCRKNIDYFKIYYSTSYDGEYQFLSNSSDTVYTDTGSPSFARCYKISAVDRDGKESELSEASCNDNCPFFMLPNVFTPGNADGFNDTFNANFDDEVVANPEEVIIRCPRFVEHVKFEVYNRWGRLVYTSTSGNGGSRNIEWPGIDSKGNELATGVYYYTADVTFNVLDPAKRFKEYRGWVKLVR